MFLVLPVELHPIIDESEATNTFINGTFNLTCLVHIELGVIIVMNWDTPAKNVNELMKLF